MSFALASASSMQRVFRDRPFDGPVGKPLELAAAMNSWVSGQVVIVAGEKKLRNVRVEVSNLKSWEVSEHPVNENEDGTPRGSVRWLWGWIQGCHQVPDPREDWEGSSSCESRRPAPSCSGS